MSVKPVLPTTTAVHTAIASASRKTGMDFNYLLGQAQVESGMRADARARTSSASGLYQFIEQSWLGVVKKHGAEHGLGWAADSIKQTSSGRYVVSDPQLRRTILGLRDNPQFASLMAAEHAADNKQVIEAKLGRDATGTDLYMAHFLGLGGAKSFLTALEVSPGRSGASMFPAAARANRNVFYDAGGNPRSLAQIYGRFADKLDSGAMKVGATGLASATLGGGDATAGKGIPQLDPALEVVLGTESDATDNQWVATTLARFQGGTRSVTGTPAVGLDRSDAFRPTPATARLAYLMLASLGA